jgi:hypothetical protein
MHQAWLQENAMLEGIYNAEDWEGIKRALVSKETIVVTDFVNRYGLGLRATNALLEMLSQVRFQSSSMATWAIHMINI